MNELVTVFRDVATGIWKCVDHQHTFCIHSIVHKLPPEHQKQFPEMSAYQTLNQWATFLHTWIHGPLLDKSDTSDLVLPLLLDETSAWFRAAEFYTKHLNEARDLFRGFKSILEEDWERLRITYNTANQSLEKLRGRASRQFPGVYPVSFVQLLAL